MYTSWRKFNFQTFQLYIDVKIFIYIQVNLLWEKYVGKNLQSKYKYTKTNYVF